MIRLFLTDIDGCLSEPYHAFDVDGFRQLRAWGAEAETDPSRPRLGICSGRAYGYVEAVAQMLDLRGPALFESGGGRFDLREARIRWSEALTPEAERQLNAVRAFFLEELVPRGGFSFDYGKRAQVSIVSLDAETLAVAVADVERLVGAEYPDLLVAPTHVSIDVLPQTLSKRAAMATTAEQEGLTLDEVAFIGDTRGDIGALEVVGASFAPANAQPEVQAAVDVVTEGTDMTGVLEAYRWCIRHNEMALRAA